MPEPTSPSYPASETPVPHYSVSGGDETVPTPPGGNVSGGQMFGPPAEPGEVGVLGPYRLVKQLGRGGMGTVYLAVDNRLGRRVALKVMLPEYAADPGARARFLREARAAAGITHDNVVTIYEADVRDGVPFIAMQLLQGYPLDEYLRNKGNPPVPQILRFAREAADGLWAAHQIGLVHRDIKPANLWLEAPSGRVKILDFGLARPVDADIVLTKSGAVVGTPAYMSPEQAGGDKVDHRTDLFSLGAVMYQLCTGRLPFEGANVMALLMALGTKEPTPVGQLNPEVPEALGFLIHQLLAKNPDHRPRSADEVARRVRAMSARPPEDAGPDSRIGFSALHDTGRPASTEARDAQPPWLAPGGNQSAERRPVRGERRWTPAAVGVVFGGLALAGVITATVVMNLGDGRDEPARGSSGVPGIVDTGVHDPDRKAPLGETTPDIEPPSRGTVPEDRKTQEPANTNPNQSGGKTGTPQYTGVPATNVPQSQPGSGSKAGLDDDKMKEVLQPEPVKPEEVKPDQGKPGYGDKSQQGTPNIRTPGRSVGKPGFEPEK